MKSYPLVFEGGLTNRQATNKFIIHHTGNPTDDDCSAESIHQSHIDNNGWAGIGYHYVVRKDGTIEVGRPHWTIGAHAFGSNKDTIGIHVCGNFDIGKPTKEQIESLALLLAKLGLDYGLDMDREHVKAHSEVYSTACCGKNLFNKLQEVCGKAIWYQLN